MVDVGCKLAMTSDKLKNLGWRPRKLEEMLLDSVESYEKAGLLQVSDGEPCGFPSYFVCRLSRNESDTTGPLILILLETSTSVFGKSKERAKSHVPAHPLAIQDGC